VGIPVAAMAVGLLASLGAGNAAQQDDKEAKDIKMAREPVIRLAEATEKKDAAETKRQEDVLLKMELLPIMKQLKLRTAGGIGIGDKPGAVTPDGIEAKLIGMARKPLPPAELDKASADFAKAAYVMAAIAEICEDKCPLKEKKGDKDPKEWKQWSLDMKKYAVEVAEAAKKKDGAAVQAAARNLNSTCNNCHGIWRD
jgi:hypothetical protein